MVRLVVLLLLFVGAAGCMDGETTQTNSGPQEDAVTVAAAVVD